MTCGSSSNRKLGCRLLASKPDLGTGRLSCLFWRRDERLDVENAVMPDGTANMDPERARLTIPPETEAVILAGSANIGGPLAVFGDLSSATDVAFRSE